MKDGFVRKVNFCSISERDRTEDCSLKAETESFRIGTSQRKLVLVLPVDADI